VRRSTLWLLGGAVTFGALVALAAFSEQAWLSGYPRVADALGASRLAVCWCWVLPAWKSLDSAQPRAWAHLGRCTLATVLTLAALT